MISTGKAKPEDYTPVAKEVNNHGKFPWTTTHSPGKRSGPRLFLFVNPEIG